MPQTMRTQSEACMFLNAHRALHSTKKPAEHASNDRSLPYRALQAASSRQQQQADSQRGECCCGSAHRCKTYVKELI